MTTLFKTPKNGARLTAGPRTFTLIELLVCIVVIMILMALLMPALSKVRYRAKLVVCMNNQKQVATAALMYASSNDARHLDRSRLLRDTRGYPAPFSLKEYAVNNPFDERAYLSEYIPFDAFQCAFHPRQDYLASSADHIRGNYSLYAGWKLMPGEKQMKKLGDTMTLGGTEFDVLVADLTVYYTDSSTATWASHPDFGAGRMQLSTRNDSILMSSLYSLSGTTQRGAIDLNFALNDGSVSTIRNIAATGDSRMKKVSYKYANDSKALSARWSLLPAVE